MNKYNRIITLVLDSVGIGALPDASKYNDDQTVNTLGNISESVGLELPNLEKMGLGNIAPIKTVKPVLNPTSNFTKMQEKADGKDTLTGHWEMMGCTLEKGFDQFVEKGFSDEFISEFEKKTGRKTLGNVEASGMKIIDKYFEEHLKTAAYIVYTSVDSTFQIAAHEEVVPLKELYEACEIAREMSQVPGCNIARVIARPFLGTKEDFFRTPNRHDYAQNPSQKTILDKLCKANLTSFGVGKIEDVFNGQGINGSVKNKSNDHGITNMIEQIKKDYKGHLFVNLVDFDSLYGHPRDVQGYKKALEAFDKRLPEILEVLKEDDLLIITADHGNDPTFRGNDHTREYVPLLVYSKKLFGNNELNMRNTFEDIGETIAENFGLESTKFGTSFLKELK